MSFLDKVNADLETKKKVNPLLKKKLQKKMSETKSENAESEKAGTEDIKIESTGKVDLNAILKKDKQADAKEEAAKKNETNVPAEEKKEEAKGVKEEKPKETAPAEEKEQEVPAETEEAKEKKKEEEKTESENKKNEAEEQIEESKKPVKSESEEKPETKDEAEEAKEPEEAKEEDPAEEEQKQEKNGSKKSSSKKSSKKKTKPQSKPAKEKEKEPEEAPELIEIPSTTMSYVDAVAQITTPFYDEEWEKFKNEIKEELSKIEISPDLNPGTLKVVVSELSIIREKIWNNYQEIKTLYETLSSKEPEGLIERVKRINIDGTNDMERRKNGILACMNYQTDEGTINLYEVLDETRKRFNFLKNVMNTIQYKTDVLITMSSALKLEKDHVVRGE